MRLSMIGAIAVAAAIATPALAYDDGPPLTDTRSVVPTWSGVTQWGNTVYFDRSDGAKGVLWQPRAGGSWFWKTSDGDSGGFTNQEAQRATSSPLYNSFNQQPPARNYSDGFSNAGYNYQQPAQTYTPPTPVYVAPPAPVYNPPIYHWGRWIRMWGW